MSNNKNNKNSKNIKKNNYNNTLSAIQYILNKRELQRKINKNDLFLHNNENPTVKNLYPLFKLLE